jgi:hypothetical protein
VAAIILQVPPRRGPLAVREIRIMNADVPGLSFSNKEMKMRHFVLALMSWKASVLRRSERRKKP